MKRVPILFYSDSPDLPTGLGRITRDLAILASGMPEFRVGVYGRGGRGSARLPFPQYIFGTHEQWGEERLPEVWSDFARGEQGIIFTIWDPSRLTWFAEPRMGGCLGRFLRSGQFHRWGYFPIDGFGPNGKLSNQLSSGVAAYERTLAYSLYGKDILERSIGREVDWIPHGYEGRCFQPREKAAGRAIIQFAEKDIVVGMVATNQARKDWGVAFETIALLRLTYPTLKFWGHTDTMLRYWDMRALANDFGVDDITHMTCVGDYSVEQLSYMYSACDVTILPSPEGFGFPLVESMACGIPAVHGNWGGGAELLPDRSWLVPARAQRLDTMWNVYRPVFSPEDWAAVIAQVLKWNEDGSLKVSSTQAVEHLKWTNLWPTWKKWFLKGIQ